MRLEGGGWNISCIDQLIFWPKRGGNRRHFNVRPLDRCCFLSQQYQTSWLDWWTLQFDLCSAHRCCHKETWGQSLTTCFDLLLFHWQKRLWHDRRLSQLGFSGGSAGLHLVICPRCSWCHKHRTRRSWKRPEKRCRWWRRRCGEEEEASPHPTCRLQLHLYPAWAGWVQGRWITDRTVRWLSRGGECCSERFPSNRQWVVISETATPGEQNGEQHTVAAEGTILLLLPSIFYTLSYNETEKENFQWRF